MDQSMERKAGVDWLEMLDKAEARLPELLEDRNRWASLWVDYHEPFVERLWSDIQIDGVDARIFLHRIHPAPLDACLFHRHPWPSAMRVLDGAYKMAVGYGADAAPPPACSLILRAGSCYEMSEPDGWHAVSPVGGPSLSIMVAGRPYGHVRSKPSRPLAPLDPAIADELFSQFERRYGRAR